MVTPQGNVFKEGQNAAQWRGVRKKRVINNSLNTRIREGGEGGWCSRDRAEIPLHPLEETDHGGGREKCGKEGVGEMNCYGLTADPV